MARLEEQIHSQHQNPDIYPHIALHKNALVAPYYRLNHIQDLRRVGFRGNWFQCHTLRLRLRFRRSRWLLKRLRLRLWLRSWFWWRRSRWCGVLWFIRRLWSDGLSFVLRRRPGRWRRTGLHSCLSLVIDLWNRLLNRLSLNRSSLRLSRLRFGLGWWGNFGLS